MAKSRKKRHATKRRKSYRRRSLGLAGISKPRDFKNDVLDIAAMAAGTFVATKGVGMLDKLINKSDTKLMGMIAPAVVTAVGVAGATLPQNRIVKSLAKGIATGGAFKLAEKVLNKPGLLAGTDEDKPLMIPGIGSFGQAKLPETVKELSHYSENNNAPVTTTSGDPQYWMGTPSEVLNGDDDFIAV